MGTLRGTETSCRFALYFNPYLRQRFQAFQLPLQEPSCWTPSRPATPVGRPRPALPRGLFSSQIRSGLAKPSRVPLGEQQPVLAVALGCRGGWRCFSSCRVRVLLFLPFYFSFFFFKKKKKGPDRVVLFCTPSVNTGCQRQERTGTHRRKSGRNLHPGFPLLRTRTPRHGNLVLHFAFSLPTSPSPADHGAVRQQECSGVVGSKA